MLDVVCVFCGSRSGRGDRYSEAARELGAALARRGSALLWGGGRVGLMGELADAALAHGGRIRGVIPAFLKTAELLHPALTSDDLIVTETLFERKEQMIRAARAFVALPGGLGTLDELFEVITLQQLGRIAKPCGLLNVAGFFEPLLAQLRRSVDEGFVDRRHADALIVGDDVEQLLDELDRRATAR